jgi:hypothetical protein
MVRDPDTDKDEGREEALERWAWVMIFAGSLKGGLNDIAKDAEIDRQRLRQGLAPRYGNYGLPNRLRRNEGGPVPAAITPKIYGGGDGSNHDPPVAGAAAVQRVRETAAEEQRERSLLLATA